MTISERREKILSLINNSNGSIKTFQLASKLNVTNETIRKDLIYLDEQNLIKKFHGGAKPIAEFTERSLDIRLEEDLDYKRAIAKEALNYVLDISVIFIDAGSTACEFAKLLVEKIKLSKKSSQLAVVTNSFAVANVLNGKVQTLFFIGGEVSNITQATSGFWSINELKSIRIDTAFLGSSGFFSHNGPTTKIGADSSFKRELIKYSSKKIVMADYTKFSTTAIMQYADWSDIDILITDCNVEEKQYKKIEHYTKVVKVGL